MAQREIESVARAFHASECDDDWNQAPEAARAFYRGLAQAAIALLKGQVSQASSHAPAPQGPDRAGPRQPDPRTMQGTGGRRNRPGRAPEPAGMATVLH